MPHDYPENFKTHLQGGATTLALLWNITRADGVIFAFTDHNEDITYDGIIYRASDNFTPSTVAQAEDLSVDTVDLTGMFADSGITSGDIRAGLFDNAAAKIYHINYTAPEDGAVLRVSGTLGEISQEGGRYKAEFRSLMQKLQQPIGRVITPACDALLGDARCGVALLGYTVSASVTHVTDRSAFSALSLTQSDGYFKHGKITFTSGGNNGKSGEIRSFGSGNIELALPMAYDISASDNFTIIAGCDKSSVACKTKFDNFLNFRGFPDVPGQDRILKVYS